MTPARVGACQVPDIRGDVDQSVAWIRKFGEEAESIDLLVFPEAFLQGYFTEEAPAREHAMDVGSREFQDVARRLAAIKPMTVIGFLECSGDALFNSAAVVHRGELIGVYRKRNLIGNEAKVFQPGESCPSFDVGPLRFGINICSDTQRPELAAAVKSTGAQLIVCPANNMLRREAAESCKELHNEVRGQRAKETWLWLVSADVTGETEERISYGPTAAINPDGVVVGQVPLHETGMVVAQIRSAPVAK